MTPIPLELPLRPNEAAEVAALIFDQAERKPLTEEVRNRIAARSAALKLESLRPWFGSLARDPVHPSAYYLAVDGAGGTPLLLYMALANAPTSSIFHKSLLIARTKRMNGPEMVINASPFGAGDHENIERYATKVDTAFLARQQGSRASITVAGDAPAAFAVFRKIHKRTGKNLAAIAGDYHAGLWAAIRSGWRHEYSAVAELGLDGTTEALRETLAYTRFAVDAGGLDQALKAAEYAREQIRQARAVLKTGGAFEFEVGLGAVTPEELERSLELLKSQGHAPQFVGVVTRGDLDGLAAVARLYQVTLSFRYAGESMEAVEAVSRATGGRVNFWVKSAEEAELVAEGLLG